ncbi:MAG: hypothetical protein OXP66_08165 [Candidatus Tectomicrobia bacterium]|nr:hypothetical protein [Candidatus Tectomicrobia bacterium]
MIPTCADLADAGLIVMISGIGTVRAGSSVVGQYDPGPEPEPPPPPTPAAVSAAAYVQHAHADWSPPAEHPLTEKVRTWWSLPKRVDRNTHLTRIMPSEVAVAPRAHPRAGRLFQPHGAGRGSEGMPLFPGLEDGEDYSRPRLPIHLHRLGLDRQHGTGAPLAERMFVEALLGAANQIPNLPEVYSVTFRDFMQALWPGQHLRPSEWLPKVEAAAKALGDREARIAWEDPASGHGGLRQVVAVTDIPRTPDKLEDLVSVTVNLPPGSRAGPLMPEHLLAWGARSHLAFVGLINLGFNWFDPGILRVPSPRGRHWLQVQDPERYPDLTPDDLLELFMPHRNWKLGGEARRNALRYVRQTIRLLEAAHGLRCEKGTRRGTVKLLPAAPDVELLPPTKRHTNTTKRHTNTTKRHTQGQLDL